MNIDASVFYGFKQLRSIAFGGAFLYGSVLPAQSVGFISLSRTPFADASISQGGARIVVSTFGQNALVQLASEADIGIRRRKLQPRSLTEDPCVGLGRLERTGASAFLIHTNGSVMFLDSLKDSRFLQDGKV